LKRKKEKEKKKKKKRGALVLPERERKYLVFGVEEWSL